jgi:transmembrane sensor
VEDRVWTLLARKLAGEATDTELKELDDMLAADPELAATVEQMTTAWQLPPDDELQQALASFANLDRRVKEGKEEKEDFEEKSFVEVAPVYSIDSKNKLRRVLAVAASVAVLMVAAWFFFLRNDKTMDVNTEVLAVREVQRSAAEDMKELTLPDGSIVKLNSFSKLEYDSNFAGDIREVWLSGEAFFDVAHNEAKPFIIHSGRVNVRVLGTAFNVKAYPDQKNVETSLIRGSVEVTVNDEPEKKYLLKPNQKLVVPFVAEQADSISKSSSEDEAKLSVLRALPDGGAKQVIAELAWMDNKFAFYELSFRNLADELEQRYNVTIQFEDKHLESLVFTGVFRKQDLKQVLYALSTASPFSYRIEKETVFISK